MIHLGKWISIFFLFSLSVQSVLLMIPVGVEMMKEKN